MVKIAYLVHKTAGISREQFLNDYEAPRTGHRASSARAFTHHVIHRPHPTDALRADALGQKARPTRCDGLSVLWFEDTTPGPVGGPRIASIARCDGYQLDEVIHWDRLPPRRPGEYSPGVKMIAFVRRREELSREEFRERYLQHVAVARQHHPGIARYVQNFVLERLDPRSPPLDAIAELHFASEDDLTRRFYLDETSPRAVGADVARFLSPRESWSILAEERVLR